MNYTEILEIKYKNYFWSINNNNYEEITWYSDTPKPTKEELDSQWDEVISIKKKQDCKDKAKQLLSESDWSTLPDVQTQLLNYQDFVNYRSQLRNLILNPVEEPIFPEEPQPIWS